MAKKNNYYVIGGGECGDICYGGTPTLIGAKRLANKNLEYFSDPSRWVRPLIYRAEDTVVEEIRDVLDKGVIKRMRVSKAYATPVPWKDDDAE